MPNAKLIKEYYYREAIKCLLFGIAMKKLRKSYGIVNVCYGIYEVLIGIS